MAYYARRMINYMSIYEKINELILVNLEQHICNEVFR